MNPSEAHAEVTRFFHPILAAKKLRGKPLRVELAGRAYALFRDSAGRPGALLDACAHRLAPLSAGRVRPDGRLACPYHGWHFDRDGRGCNPSQPTLTKCDVPSFQVIERHGYLWLAARGVRDSALPEMGWPGFDYAGAFAARFRAPLHVTLDNFSEDEHLPWLHTRLGWDETTVGTVEFSADNFDDRIEVRYRARQRKALWTHLLLIRPDDWFENNFTIRFDPVRISYSLRWTDALGAPRPLSVRSVVHFVPETASITNVHSFVFLHSTRPELRLAWPLIKAAALALGSIEVHDDARFIPTVAHTPFSLDGMRLDKYDKPLVHSRRLLQRIYFGQPDPVSPAT